MSNFNPTGFTSVQQDTSTRGEAVIQQYRGQEARLTRRLRWLIVVVVLAAAASVWAISAGDAVHAGAVIAGTLLCLSAAGQTRAARNRVRQLLESGAADKIAHRIAETSADPRLAGPQPLFSQQYCRVNRQFAGGRMQAGPGLPMFQVIVQDSLLVVIQAPATPVMRVPVPNVQLATPKLQRKLGTVTTLRIGDQLWGFDFSAVYLAERGAGFARQMFSFGSPRKSTRRAREITQRFVTALMQSGVHQ
jgi:hypothetical protein